MGQLTALIHSQDICCVIFSWLDLQSLANVEQSCLQFYNFARGNFVNGIVYKLYILKLFSNHLIQQHSELCHLSPMILNWSKFQEYLERENCRELLVEFYETPFMKMKKLDENCYLKYKENGGVLEFHLISPCKLLKLLLKCFRNELSEQVRISFHKFVLFAVVCDWKLTSASKFFLGLSDREISFNFADSYSVVDFPFTQHSMGSGLLKLLNNFQQLEAKHELIFSCSTENSLPNSSSSIIYMDFIRNSQPEKGWMDVFRNVSEIPDFEMKQDATHEITALISILFNEKTCEHYNWENCIARGDTTWSMRWLGYEWLCGYTVLTSYDYLNERFIVSLVKV